MVLKSRSYRGGNLSYLDHTTIGMPVIPFSSPEEYTLQQQSRME